MAFSKWPKVRGVLARAVTVSWIARAASRSSSCPKSFTNRTDTENQEGVCCEDGGGSILSFQAGRELKQLDQDGAIQLERRYWRHHLDNESGGSRFIILRSGGDEVQITLGPGSTMISISSQDE